MAHCGGGVGHGTVDWLTPIVQWVERASSRTPSSARHEPETSTRPHCPYPEEAVYDGVGDPNDAASYSCKKLD